MTTYHQVLNQLEALKLNKIRNHLPTYLDDHASVSLVDGLHDLCSEEIRGRDSELQAKRLKRAHLPYVKRVNDFDFQFQPK